MNSDAELLMTSGLVRFCPDCHVEQWIVPVEGDRFGVDFCCTACGAALIIDPIVELLTDRRVA